jgi:hypothetical protein
VKLMLSGVSEQVWQRLLATETTESIPEEDVFLSEEIPGSSTQKALEAAAQWIEDSRSAMNRVDEADAGSNADIIRSWTLAKMRS